MSNTNTDLINNFPDEIDPLRILKDVDIHTRPIVDEYYRLFNQGDFEGIDLLFASNPVLKDMIWNAYNMQYLYDMNISTQRLYMNDIQQYLINIVKYKDTWASDVTYTKYDVVRYNTGVLIECFIGIKTKIPVGTLPTNALYFVPITLSGATFIPSISPTGDISWTNDKQLINPQTINVRGATYTPIVDDFGNISWTNDKGLPNPTAINIKGAAGVGMTPQGVWNGNVPYEKYAVVSYENKLWYSIEPNTNQLPKPDSIYWAIALQINDGNADTVDNYHVDNTKGGTNTTTDDALWTAYKIKEQLDTKASTATVDTKADKIQIITFNGTATELRSNMNISVLNNNVSTYSVTFTAPADFNPSHTYTINDIPVTVTDLNNEPLEDAWKQGSLVTFNVTGNKAFFKSGGGISVRKGIAEENLSSFANGSVNADGTVSQRPISLISTLKDADGTVYKNLSFIYQDGVLHCWGWTTVNSKAYLAKLHCFADLSLLILDTPLFATGYDNITSIVSTSPNRCIILGLNSTTKTLSIANMVYDNSIKILGNIYTNSLGTVVPSEHYIFSTGHKDIYAIYYTISYTYSYVFNEETYVSTGNKPRFGVWKWDDVSLKFTSTSVILNDESEKNSPQGLAFTFDKTKTQLMWNYTRTSDSHTLQYSYGYTYHIFLSSSGTNSKQVLSDWYWPGGSGGWETVGNRLSNINATDSDYVFLGLYGNAGSSASSSYKITNGTMSSATALSTYFGGSMIKYNTYFLEKEENLGGTPQKYSRINNYLRIDNLDQSPYFQTSRNPSSETKYFLVNDAKYICDYNSGSLLYGEATQKLYKYEGENTGVLLLKETLKNQKVPYIRQTDLNKI